MKLFITSIFILAYLTIYSQRVPSESENIDYLMTFGKSAASSAGDDDHVQILFFIIPADNENPVYIRVYDPNTGGKHDDLKGTYNSKTKYSIYGGSGAFSNEDARGIDPKGDFKSGNILASKVFGSETTYDAKWYTFGPFNPREGEFSSEIGGNIFKVIAEGVVGDDGNAYRYFLSTKSDRNLVVEGANAFAYEYTFKMPLSRTLSHIYPFIDKTVVSITQHNFDFDNDGQIFIYSVSKNRHIGKVSGDNEWATSKFMITKEETNTTLDLQMLKGDELPNSMSVYITNQYSVPIPFFAIPIGGPPKYKYDLSLKYKSSPK